MANWNRTPKGINVGRLIFDGQRRLVLDKASAGDLLGLLTKQTLVEVGIAGAEDFNAAIVQLCRQEQAILITANSSYISMIFSESNPPWGMLLLPSDSVKQKEVVRRMLSGNLSIRSSEEGMVFTEYLRRNRMILDVRRERPELIVMSKCQWQ